MKELFPEITYTAIDTRAKSLKYDPQRDVVSGMRVASMSGVIMDSERYWRLNYSDAVPNQASLEDLVDSSGEWTAIFVREQEESREFLCVADHSGFAPLFFSLLPNKAVVVSSTFSGAVQGVQQLKGQLTLNEELYLTLISGIASTFSNLISAQTHAKEIQILPYDKALFVSEDEVHLVDRESVSPAQRVSTYESALKQGIASSGQIIKRVAKNHPEAPKAITLTGGADSRMVLAILLTIGREKDFGLWTIDPRERKSPYQQKVFTADVEIANELRRHYGMKWAEPFVREKISVSFSESLSWHQSYNSNFAYTFSPSNAIAYNQNPILTLRGGGGEILRGTGGARIFANRYRKATEEQLDIDENTWITDAYLESSLITGSAQSLVHDYLRQSVVRQSQESLRKTLDSYYRATRNRAHFGHIRKSAGVNDRLIQVLTNPFLVRAMELIDYETKTSGTLVQDLYDQTFPELRNFPFESPSTDKQLRRSPREEYKYVDRDGWKKDFDKRGRPSRSLGFRPLYEPGARGDTRNLLISEDTRKYIDTGFSDLVEVIPTDMQNIVRSQHDLIQKNLNENNISAGSVAAKVASALDVFSPMSLDVPGEHLYTNKDRSDRIFPSNHLEQRSAPYHIRK